MKKLIALSYAVLCIVLMVIAYQNYSQNILESIEGGKQKISIEKPKEVTNDTFLKNIANAAMELNTDIVYKYVDVDEMNTDYMYYVTDNTDGFLDAESAKALSNIEFYTFDQADKYDLSTGNYYVNNKLCDAISGKISKFGYNVTIPQSSKRSGKTPVGLFTTIPIILLILSITFYMLSIGKRTVLRKMEGYTNFAILKEEFLGLIPMYLVIGLIIEMVGLLFVKFNYNNFIINFLKYQSGYIILLAIIIVVSAIVSLVCICSQQQIAHIKGKVPKKGIYVISMLTTIVFMVFISFFMSVGIRNIKACYDVYKTSSVMVNKTKEYVSIPIYQNSASCEGLEDNYMDFYKKTVNAYDGVLVFSGNYKVDPISGKSGAEAYDQDDIIVNENYLKINPIYESKDKPVSLVESRGGKVINVILPYEKKDEMAKYDEMIKLAYKAEANFVFYDSTITDVYSYNAEVGNRTYGKLDAPVIIVLNTENLTGDFVLSYCSQESYIIKPRTNSPYDELKPILEEVGILTVTPQTPYVASNYSTELADELDKLKLYGTQSVFLIMGLLLLVSYTAILYCNNYKKKIICKIIEGYSTWQCVSGHIIFKVAIYLISMIAVYIMEIISRVGMNYKILIVTFIVDIIITIVLCLGINKNNVYDVVKGE